MSWADPGALGCAWVRVGFSTAQAQVEHRGPRAEQATWKAPRASGSHPELLSRVCQALGKQW